MLNPEVAQERLKDIRIQDWRSQRMLAIPQLPDAVRSVAYGALNQYRPEGLNPSMKIAPLETIDTWDASDRGSLFTFLFPQIASTVEATWQFLKQIPYQSGYTRRPFRAPTEPQYSLAKRTGWLYQLINTVEGYEQDLVWFAAWTPYLGYYANETLGLLFAAAINQNDDIGHQIQEILIASARGDHDTGAMGRHVTRALLTADCPEGWEFIEKLLLAAQRQEGLRQTIFESIDEAHPQAFRRILRLIVDHKLTRFSATIRGLDVWLGFALESLDEKRAKPLLQTILSFLEDDTALQAGLQGDDAQTVYLALWSAGFKDAIATIPLATQLLSHDSVNHRFVAVHFLAQLDIDPARIALLAALADPHLAIAGGAVQALLNNHNSSLPNPSSLPNQSDVFERLAAIFERFPEKPKRISLVWDWVQFDISQQQIAIALWANLGERSPKHMMPYLSSLEPYGRAQVAERLAAVKPWDTDVQATLLGLVGDASQWVQERVIRILQTCTLTDADCLKLEKLLTRKSSSLRRGILGLLLNQQTAIAIAQRLLQAKNSLQRQAGLELLKELVLQKRCVNECQADAATYQANHSKLTTTETQLLDGILNTETEVSLTDALGLVTQLTPLMEPEVVAPEINLYSEAAHACLLALDELVHEHRQTPIKLKNWQGEDEEALLGDVQWNFPRVSTDLSREENLANLPLADVWLNWWRDRPDTQRDADGLELVRAMAPHAELHHLDSFMASLVGGDLFQSILNQSTITVTALTQALEPAAPREPSLLERTIAAVKALSGSAELIQRYRSDSEARRYSSQVNAILQWLIYLHPPAQVSSFSLDAIAALLKTIPIQELLRAKVWKDYYSNRYTPFTGMISDWINFGRSLFTVSVEQPDTCTRWWHLLRWYDYHYWNYYPASTLCDLFAAHQVGAATESDLIFFLAGAHEPEIEADIEDGAQQPQTNLAEAKANVRTHFNDLAELTRRTLPERYAHFERLRDLADRLRQRILDIELQRGDLPTAASNAALCLRSVIGIPTVIQLLRSLEEFKLVRGYIYHNLSKPAIISHLMRVSFPAPDDTPTEFTQRVQSAGISTERLLQLAFFAPQWVNYVQEAIAWPGFTEAVWWFHAHTKDNGWSVEQDVRETWVAQISERTPLDAKSLVQGAVDVAWFQRVYKSLKPEQWQQIYEAAQYAASGQGHQRAKQFADAMLGHLDRAQLIDRITKKRHQDSVRSLGLLPLANGKKRSADLLERYKILQEFLRTSKQFGSQRQASETLAVTIGLDNLARTAGYIDPQRLQWAMELQEMADLASGSLTVTVESVSMTLSIDAWGDPDIAITKSDKPLKAIPAKLKKHPQIQALTTRKQDILKQASRMRQSLEQAMCRGDRFTAEELIQLTQHPVLFPMLAQLVLMGDREMGYLVENGTALQNHSGQITPIESSTLRLAHPHDLLISQEWHLWQQDCFSHGRSQPVKQVFRELYVPTAAERSDTLSRRYEGHQVNPKQALALFGQRGWLVSYESGVQRTFHAEKLIASVDFQYGYYTPLEVEGQTISGVQFWRRDEWKPLKLSEIPPILFSEAMRDLDLVVSVAHVGGVDPEATASTVEMRASLVREACRLMKLTNVQIQSSHVLIEGELGSYSVHLGSAVVHRQPGGSLCIVPVHAQHRGRIFLPFVDNDPKTAEVISKVLLLARDRDIKDPTILEQIL